MILASQFSRLSLEPCICPRCRSDITGRATDMEQFLRFIIVCQSLSSFLSSSMLWLFLYSFFKEWKLSLSLPPKSQSNNKIWNHIWHHELTLNCIISGQSTSNLNLLVNKYIVIKFQWEVKSSVRCSSFYYTMKTDSFLEAIDIGWVDQCQKVWSEPDCCGIQQARKLQATLEVCNPKLSLTDSLTHRGKV